MIILKSSGLAQTFNVIPRRYTADSMDIKGSEGTTSYSIASIQDGRYLTFDKIVTLVEGQFYTLTVLDGTDIVYSGRIFCTNQTVANYTINNGEYVETTSNNDYIIVD